MSLSALVVDDENATFHDRRVLVVEKAGG